MFTALYQAEDLFQKVLLAVEVAIPPQFRERILESYEWNEHRSKSQLASSCIDLFTDFIFYLPVIKLAEGLSASNALTCSTYFFHQVGLRLNHY